MQSSPQEVARPWAGLATVRAGDIIQASSGGIPDRFTVLSDRKRDAFGTVFVEVDRQGVGPVRLYDRDLPANVEVIES